MLGLKLGKDITFSLERLLSLGIIMAIQVRK